MYFLIEDEDLLKKYKDTWNKFKNSMEKDCSELIYNKKFLETKMNLKYLKKSYGDMLEISMISKFVE